MLIARVKIEKTSKTLDFPSSEGSAWALSDVYQADVLNVTTHRRFRGAQDWKTSFMFHGNKLKFEDELHPHPFMKPYFSSSKAVTSE